MADQDHTISTPTKRCSKCRNFFPATPIYFYRSRKEKSGLESCCKACKKHINEPWRLRNKPRCAAYTRAYRARQSPEERHVKGREYYAQNREKLLAKDKIYNKTKAFRARSVALYQQNRLRRLASSRESREKNRAKISARAKSRRLQNLAAMREKEKAYSSQRRARIRQLATDFTAQDWQKCLAYWDGCCAVCGRAEGLFWMIVPDHWIALCRSFSPGHTKGNIVPLCHSMNGAHQSCNLTKHARDPEEWLVWKLGPRKAKAKLKEIRTFFAVMQEGV